MPSSPNRRDPDPAHPTSEAVPTEAFRDLPPSAKLVLTVLDGEGPLTQQAIAAETRLPKRTVRHAIGRLEAAGMIDRELYLPDARQSTFSLRVELPG